LHALTRLKNYSLGSCIAELLPWCLLLQWLVGLLSFLIPVCSQPVRAFILPIHTFFGVVIFCCAVATAMMGITEKLIWTLYVINLLHFSDTGYTPLCH